MPGLPSNGVFLYSLDPEIGISPETASEAIAIESLFSRQVCLNESHVLDNRAIWDFFEKNTTYLQTMLDGLESEEIPILGLCSRKGSDILGLLDLWLEPRDTGVPNYFTSLSPEQNDALEQKPYPQTKEGRRSRLYAVAPEFPTLVEHLIQYFQRDSPRTTVLRAGSPDRQLYPSVKVEISQLLSNPNLTDEDRVVADRLTNAIDSLRPGEVQTRDRLHRAIYNGIQPRFHRHAIRQYKGTAAPNEIRDEWRFFVNSIYNHNLAKNLDVRPVLNTRWWTVGRRWLSADSIRQRLRLEPAGKLALVTPLYRDCLNLEFAVETRKMAKFRDGIFRLEAARNNAQDHVVHRALEEHLTFISEQFATYLIKIGEGHIVGPRLKDIVVRAADRIGSGLSLGAGPVLASLLLQNGLPPDSALQAWKESSEAGHIAAWSAEAIFSLSPSSIRDKRIPNAEFKSVVAELENLSGYKA